MNRQIVRLTQVALVLVGVLVVMTTYWQTWAAASLADRQDNAIRRVHEFSIDRGLIFSFEPRKRLARNREREVDGRTLYFRRYPYGPLTAHVVGYSTVGRSRLKTRCRSSWRTSAPELRGSRTRCRTPARGGPGAGPLPRWCPRR